MPQKRVLVVQCCHLPQFSFVVEKIRRKHPEWLLEGLVCPNPELEHYRQFLQPLETIHSLPDQPSESPWDLLIFPLLNGGYRKIKQAARALDLPSWECDYQGESRPLEARRLYLSLAKALHRPTPAFTEYRSRFLLHPLPGRVLLMKSCHDSLVSKSEQLWKKLIQVPDNLIRVGPGSAREVWSQVSGKRFDGAVVFFSGEQGFTLMKWIPFLLRIPRVLVLTESGHAFYASPRELARFLAGRIMRGTPKPEPAPHILVVQTETPALVAAAIRKLRKELYPHSRVTLLCLKKHRALFDDDPNLDDILEYTPSGPLGTWRLRQRVGRLDVDMACALFSGRPLFRKPKLFFLSLPIRPHIVFNGRLDCYPLGLKNLPWLLRKDTLTGPFDELDGTPQRVLFFQTDSHPISVRALQQVTQGHVIPNASIAVMCSQQQRQSFEGLPRVVEVFDYQLGAPKQNLLTLWRMIRWKPEVSAAIFSGRTTFWKQKLLFWLVPVRHRLILNEDLDCYFLNWRNLRWLWTTKPGVGPRRALRSLVRCILFLPRFGYLLCWATLVKVRRALSNESRNPEQAG